MIKVWLKDKIQQYYPDFEFEVLIPPDEKMGDYSVNLAFVLAKKNGTSPADEGKKILKKFLADREFGERFGSIEFAAPGFVNLFLKKEFLHEQLLKISKDERFGLNERLKGKIVMVEYTDPNPFKLFHIGHLMSNAIGEAIARLYEASGAKVLRVNYQGDVGLHVAKAIWGMKYGGKSMPEKNDSLDKKMEFLGYAYAYGSAAYENPEFKTKIEEINDKIYKKDDDKIQELYEKGRKWSLEYFETIYEKLGTKFDHYFFESETGSDGLDIVKKHPDIFVESDGAIVFKGEEYDLHTRVFINSKGLPTYEAKELGLNKKKFDLYSPDLSVIVTGNEIFGYFKVLLKAMELVMPDVAAKTRHVPHGMLRLPTGKMSSRTGDVITADSLIEQIKAKLPESDDVSVNEKIAIGAIKYSILKQSPGHDVIFDFEKSLSVKGDAAPYLQYTYARLNSIVAKAGQKPTSDFIDLSEPVELALIKRVLKLPDVVMESSEEIAPQHLALYLYELANDASRFYESVRVLDDDNTERRNARLMLVETVATVLKCGLNVLGIETPERV